jgi:hypothetical protein
MWNLRWSEYGEARDEASPPPKRRPDALKPPKKKKEKGKGKAPVVDYGRRDEILRAMGYESYRDYLRSPLWSKIRRRVFGRDEGKCRICGERGEQVHHQSYDARTLKGKTIKRLLLLCRRCHEEVEVDGLGRKRSVTASVAEARARVRKLPLRPNRRRPKRQRPEHDMEAEFLDLARSF